MTVAVTTTPRAEEQARAVARWWLDNRPAAPELFVRELENAFTLLSAAPDIGHRYEHPDIPGLRRLLLRRTRYHVYYVHSEQRREVIILAVWSAVRGRGPDLGSVADET